MSVVDYRCLVHGVFSAEVDLAHGALPPLRRDCPAPIAGGSGACGMSSVLTLRESRPTAPSLAGLTWYEDVVARVRVHAVAAGNQELVQACDAVGPLEGQLGYTTAKRALERAVEELCSPTATGKQCTAVETAANEVHIAISFWRTTRRHARRVVAAAIRDLDAQERRARAVAMPGADSEAVADLGRPVIPVQVSGRGRLTLNLVLIEDSAIARVVETLSTLLHRVGVPQDLGDAADEVTCLTTGDATVALAELTRLAGEHGIELRPIKSEPSRS